MEFFFNPAFIISFYFDKKTTSDQFIVILILQGFRGHVGLMESAIQAVREFLGHQDYQGNQENGAIQGFRGFVIPPCAIRHTTSGNITAKDPISDDTVEWEMLLLA